MIDQDPAPEVDRSSRLVYAAKAPFDRVEATLLRSIVSRSLEHERACEAGDDVDRVRERCAVNGSVVAVFNEMGISTSGLCLLAQGSC